MPYSARHILPAQKRLLLIGVLITIIFAVVFGIFTVRKIITSPDIPFLFSVQEAEWIRFREPVELKARGPQTLVYNFRTQFVLKEVPNPAILSFRSMKCATVWLDNKLVYKYDPKTCIKKWKRVYHVDLTPELGRGSHEIRIEVLNQNGYPALIAYCKPLKLYTGEHWEGSRDSKIWTQALPAKRMQVPALSGKFQRADLAFLSKLHFFMPVFIIVFLLSFFCLQKDQHHWFNPYIPTARQMRWVLLVSWSILAINNLGKIPMYIGMDWNQHLKYILYVAEHRRIPLPSEGWQMFEAPMFYIISAVIYKFLLNFFSLETTIRLLRMVPLLCGAAQIEICYRALRYVYPKREDLQAIGTVIGGLIPINIYMSQVIGTEPLAGFFSGIVVVLALRLFSSPSIQSRDIFVLLGFFLGLSILTKITAILLIPPLMFFMAFTFLKKDKLSERFAPIIIKRMILVLGISFVVSGWYYLNNWVEMGKFFIAGWDPSRNISWWQHPGYRTWSQLLGFGKSLFYPIYSSVVGLWDSLYSTLWLDGSLSGMDRYSHRPPWNYDFLLSSTWLSLLPSASILLGIFTVLKKPAWAFWQGLFFAACCIIVYVSAIFYIFLTIPIYSVGKASYTLGVIPCYAVLSAGGFEIFTHKPLARAILNGFIACWAFGVYLAYFVF
ncbi:MAG: hypothetical protein PVJ50_05535 [Desulfobacterales bacterium]